jgi:hypothetical protein
VIEYRRIENILDTYSLDEILERNNLTEVDVLYRLYENGDIELPEPKPLDFDD